MEFGLGLSNAIFLLQDLPVNGIWSVIDRYGLPLAMLAVLMLGVWKMGWPLLLKQIEQTRLMLDVANSRADKNQEAFLKALERRDAILKEGFEMFNTRFQEVHTRLGELQTVREYRSKHKGTGTGIQRYKE